jgi:hypothetical protein
VRVPLQLVAQNCLVPLKQIRVKGGINILEHDTVEDETHADKLIEAWSTGHLLGWH